MRRGLVVGGIIVAIIGAIFLVLYLVASAAMAESIPDGSAGGALSLTPTTLGPAYVTVTWSGATSTTTVTIASCPPSGGGTTTCKVASATGSSGSLTASLQGGGTYYLWETGTSGGLSGHVQVGGINGAFLLGAILVVVGALLAVVGVRKAAKPKAEVTAPAEGEMFRVGPAPRPNVIVGSAPSAPSTGTAAPAVAPVGVRAAPPPPPTVYRGTMPSASAPAPSAGGGRPPVKCAYCGTENEPWLVTCRRCKRPLKSTGM